ncbi:MAG TPA: hypothetical protein VMT22_07700, partial [Terriglobales bacterium]|nr:hypothetical protein [Terriglobales bacterium]
MHIPTTVSKPALRFLFLMLSALLVSSSSELLAAQLQLTWVDNSTNETGFNIERKTGTGGAFAQIASVGADVTSYTDATLADGNTYCYRVYAFNTAGNSPSTPEVCGTTAGATQTFTLAVANAGTGAGTMTSAPAGINCPASCSGTFNAGTVVTLTAAPASGAVFAGWSGSGCNGSASGVSVTMIADTACTATFNTQAVSTVTPAVTTAGTGGVSSSPTGVDCGSACTATSNAPSSADASITRIGVFRPSTGQWFLDANGNGLFDGCSIDTCVSSFGSGAMLPVVADWDGSGHTSIGVFEPNTGNWHLDNGNGTWDDCTSTGDICVTTYGGPNSLPVVKELSAEKLVLGTFQAQVTTRVGRKNVT